MHFQWNFGQFWHEKIYEFKNTFLCECKLGDKVIFLHYSFFKIPKAFYASFGGWKWFGRYAEMWGCFIYNFAVFKNGKTKKKNLLKFLTKINISQQFWIDILKLVFWEIKIFKLKVIWDYSEYGWLQLLFMTELWNHPLTRSAVFGDFWPKDRKIDVKVE